MTVLDNRPVTTVRPSRPDWREHAACKPEPGKAASTDTDLFFAVGNDWNSPANRDRATRAKAICSHCMARTDCLIFALNEGDTWSIAGGLLPDERRGHQ